MANLLPQEYRRGIYSEYKLRITIGGLVFMAIGLAVGVLFLAPPMLLTQTQYQQRQAVVESAKRAASSSTSTSQYKKAIEVANHKLSLLDTTSNNQLQPTDIIQVITQSESEGISVRRITINRKTDDGTAQADVSGVADTRDTLLKFEKNLSNNARVKNVDLPVSTLASRENPEFSLTVTLQSL